MSNSRAPTLQSLVESFFRVYLIQSCGASPNTICAYRDTLRMLFIYLCEYLRRPIESLRLDDVNVNATIAFLEHLEKDRSNKIASRNARLAAIHTFVRYLLENDPEHAAQYARVLSLRSKRAPIGLAKYLEPEEVKELLAQPDQSTPAGGRDYALLLFLYNTGARISEALNVRAEDLSLDKPQHARILGKGNKTRICPLWPETARALSQLPEVRNGRGRDVVFCNRSGGKLTRDGASYLLRKYNDMAARTAPAFPKGRISPHVLRHSCAVALLQGGVELTVIRDYLGHKSIATTNRYVSTNLKMKRETLEKFWRKSGITPSRARWEPKPSVLAVLEAL